MKTKSDYFDVSERIEKLEGKHLYLEAFLVQLTYVEALVRKQFLYRLSVEVEDSKIKDAVIKETKYISGLLEFSKNAKWLSVGELRVIKNYSEGRNKLVHNILEHVSLDKVNKNAQKYIKQGESIIEVLRLVEKMTLIVHQLKFEGAVKDSQKKFNFSSLQRRIVLKTSICKTEEELAKEFGVYPERMRKVLFRTVIEMEGLEFK